MQLIATCTLNYPLELCMHGLRKFRAGVHQLSSWIGGTRAIKLLPLPEMLRQCCRMSVLLPPYIGSLRTNTYGTFQRPKGRCCWMESLYLEVGCCAAGRTSNRRPIVCTRTKRRSDPSNLAAYAAKRLCGDERAVEFLIARREADAIE